MAVSPVKTDNTVAISNMHEARDERQREKENKKASKNKQPASEAQAGQEAAVLQTEPEVSIEAQIKSQPVDTEKVIELLAQKITPAGSKAQILELSNKRVKKTAHNKLDKIY